MLTEVTIVLGTVLHALKDQVFFKKTLMSSCDWNAKVGEFIFDSLKREVSTLYSICILKTGQIGKAMTA